MQPRLQAPVSVNATLELPSSLLCSSGWRAALPSGLALRQSTAGQFAIRAGVIGRCGAVRAEFTNPNEYNLDAKLLPELMRKAGCDSNSGA